MQVGLTSGPPHVITGRYFMFDLLFDVSHIKPVISILNQLLMLSESYIQSLIYTYRNTQFKYQNTKLIFVSIFSLKYSIIIWKRPTYMHMSKIQMATLCSKVLT